MLERFIGQRRHVQSTQHDRYPDRPILISQRVGFFDLRAKAGDGHQVEILGQRVELSQLRDALGGVKDLVRLVARMGSGGGNARDVIAVARSLQQIPPLKSLIATIPSEVLAACQERLTALPKLVGLIERALADEPPALLRDGGIIQAGYHAELDALREAALDGRRFVPEPY